MCMASSTSTKAARESRRRSDHVSEKGRARRRVLIGLVAAVVLAMGTTVAIAWIEALREDPRDAVYAMWGGFIRPPLKSLPAYNWPLGPPAGAMPREMTIFTHDAFGWPWPALLRQIEWSSLLSVQHAWEGVTGYRIDKGLETPLTLGTLVTPNGRQMLYRVLPTQPIWHGFGYNTIVFAAGWGLLLAMLAVPGALRRRHRARHGLCVSCGYDLRHSVEVCPECGRAIEASAAGGAAKRIISAPRPGP